jgi:hypothetical protein
MTEQNPSLHSESFWVMQAVQQDLERRGYFFHPVEKEHTEGLVTDPLLARIRTSIRKRSFEKVASRTAITFSGYAQDPREIFEIPEVRSYWQELDAQLPELPALLTHIPQLRYNGPGMHLELIGEVDLALPDPRISGYHLHVVNGQPIIDQALRRIRHAGAKYHLQPQAVNNLCARFAEAATAELEPPQRL